MTKSYYIDKETVITTDAGLPAAGYKLYTRVSGSDTLKDSFTDSTGGSTNANPIIVPADGRVSVWLNEAEAYRITLTTDADVEVFEEDNVYGRLNPSTTFADGALTTSNWAANSAQRVLSTNGSGSWGAGTVTSPLKIGANNIQALASTGTLLAFDDLTVGSGSTATTAFADIPGGFSTYVLHLKTSSVSTSLAFSGAAGASVSGNWNEYWAYTENTSFIVQGSQTRANFTTIVARTDWTSGVNDFAWNYQSMLVIIKNLKSATKKTTVYCNLPSTDGVSSSGNSAASWFVATAPVAEVNKGIASLTLRSATSRPGYAALYGFE